MPITALPKFPWRFSALGFILSSQLAAADRPADEVARYVRAEMQAQHIPGLSLLVSRNGSPVREEGYGLCNSVLMPPLSAR
jgi:CubicO group peptidase (beta-lactamase class C family)